ncbi:MAG: phage tail protein [Wenzhouxiangellaceae bacterium]
MNKRGAQAVVKANAARASHAEWLVAPARPPHDPLRLPLDNRVGWRLRATLSEHIEIAPHDGALSIAAEPGSGRRLNEAGGSFGGLVSPPSVAPAPDGSVFVLDWARARLLRFDACTCRFEAVPCLGGFGDGPRQLGALVAGAGEDATTPQAFPGIGICGGNLFICDPGNHRLQVFSLHGFVLRGFWNPPSAELDQPWQPQAVAFDARGYVFVADPANGCIHRFNAGGRWLDCIDGVGAVRALATDCAGRLYLYSGPNVPVQILDPAAPPPAPADGRVAHVLDRFDRLAFIVTPEGYLDLSALCVDATGQALFDLHGRPVKQTPQVLAPSYAQHAVSVSAPLDSRLYQCRWDRISIQGHVPEGARIRVYTYTAETELSDAQIQNLDADAWATAQTILPGKLRPMDADAATGAPDWDCLIRSAPGRYLWLRLEWSGDGTVTPRVQRVLIDFPRISLRRYLPAVFGVEPVSADFTDRFLALFDHGLRSVESRLDSLAEFFDPLSAPAGRGRDDFLGWLASWIGVTLDRQLPLERQRHILKQAGSLFALRGTLCGVRKSLELYLGLERAACARNRAECAPCTLPAPPPWQPPRLLLEHFKLRRWLFLGAGRLGDQSRLWGHRIVNRSRLGGPQTDGNARLGVSQLKTAQDPFRDPFHVYAHRFSVFVPACFGRSPRRRKGLERLIELEKPAHTAHQLIFVEPRFRIGVQSMIGYDAVVGCYPEGVVLNQAGLGKASVLGARVTGGPQLRVGQNARIGTTSRLS